jgi:hypothetical protein
MPRYITLLASRECFLLSTISNGLISSLEGPQVSMLAVLLLLLLRKACSRCHDEYGWSINGTCLEHCTEAKLALTTNPAPGGPRLSQKPFSRRRPHTSSLSTPPRALNSQTAHTQNRSPIRSHRRRLAYPQVYGAPGRTNDQTAR